MDEVAHAARMPRAAAHRPRITLAQRIGQPLKPGHTRALQLPHDRQHIRNEPVGRFAMPSSTMAFSTPGAMLRKRCTCWLLAAIMGNEAAVGAVRVGTWSASLAIART